jgi:hypothetical protein
MAAVLAQPCPSRTARKPIDAKLLLAMIGDAVRN